MATSILEAQVPLQTLKINFGPNFNSSKTSDLLNAHAETLEHLKYDGGPSTKFLKKKVVKLPWQPYFTSNVVLPKLKELVFENGCVWAFYILDSMDLPELESLRVESPMISKNAKENRNFDLDHKLITRVKEDGLSSDTFLGLLIFPKLSKFFYFGPRHFSANDLKTLAESMPNVTDLGLQVGDIKTFPIVYELWPSLLSLHVLASDRTFLQFDDYAITGLPMAEENDGDGVGLESRKSNITNLKDLRKFVLETRLVDHLPLPRRPLITDLSAVYGFLQLPKLRTLQMETLCKFSPKINAALESHLLEMNVKRPEAVCVNTDDDVDDDGDDDTSCSESDSSDIECSDPGSFHDEEDTADDNSNDSEFDAEMVINEGGDGDDNDNESDLDE